MTEIKKIENKDTDNYMATITALYQSHSIQNYLKTIIHSYILKGIPFDRFTTKTMHTMLKTRDLICIYNEV